MSTIFKVLGMTARARTHDLPVIRQTLYHRALTPGSITGLDDILFICTSAVVVVDFYKVVVIAVWFITHLEL